MQNEVDDVVGIMRQNVERIVERGQNLAELDQRSEALREHAQQFEITAVKLQRKHCWANIKMNIVMGVVGIILIVGTVGEKTFFILILMKTVKHKYILS